MSNTSLYDEDILLWSEQQAEIVRKLGRTRRDLPNEFDVENVAEEIESVGRSELAAVETNIELILRHLLKLALEPDGSARRHWLGEIFGFHRQMKRRYSPSMRQRIDIDEIWGAIREELVLKAEEPYLAGLSRLPVKSPITLDEVLSSPDGAALADRVRRLMSAQNGT